VLRTCVAKHDGEVFRFQILDFERANEGLYKICFRDVEIGEFDTGALPSGRFRSCDEWMLRLHFRQVGYTG